MSALTGDAWPERVRIVDSHTEGEPTRVVLEGWPQPEGATMAARRDDLAQRFDALRRAVVCEPRGHDAIVGALLTPPVEEGSQAGVIFFNNSGYLGMCGHGLIGVVRTLAELGRLEGTPGEPVRIDTPAGTAEARLDADVAGAVTVRNVPSYCHQLDVALEIPGLGTVTGDVAYGGNWFYLAELDKSPALPALRLMHLDALLDATRWILHALAPAGVTGEDGAEIDHVEITGPSPRDDADGRNFVLCPGEEYDRSPCGTGTSAKMAVLHARGKLEIGEVWRQESITGGLFEGWLERGADGQLVPSIRGRAFVTSEAVLRFSAEDPHRGGFSAR